MNNNFWVKTTNFKLLGKTLFTKEEICTDMQYEGEFYQINVTKDYFKSEFEVNKKDDNGNGQKRS